jgi:hypothetical protein
MRPAAWPFQRTAYRHAGDRRLLACTDRHFNANIRTDCTISAGFAAAFVAGFAEGIRQCLSRLEFTHFLVLYGLADARLGENVIAWLEAHPLAALIPLGVVIFAVIVPSYWPCGASAEPTAGIGQTIKKGSVLEK